MRIVVLGARGQLGAAVVREAKAAREGQESHSAGLRHDVVALGHEDLDVTDARAVQVEMARVRPDVIVNCTGYNAVDLAEDRPVEALRLNAFAVRNMARAAAAMSAMLVHYGSDFVFDGETATPYTEEDRPNPRSTYAASKMLGEWFAEDAPQSYVLRVESLFGRVPDDRPPKGTVAGIVAGLLAGTPVTVFSDRTVSPTYVFDAARATLELIERRAAPGVYHCVNSGHTTWADFAREAARLLEVDPKLKVVSVADVQLKALRPRYCALSNVKLAAAGVPMPTWEHALARFIKLELRS
jgi:dTDP-4-dehydrorhamnose reductase